MTAARATATERRAQAITAGMRVFADHGLTMSAVRQVAEEIGVSQPYVFRLFGNKLDFFLACLDEMEQRIRAAFVAGASESPGEQIPAMGAGFRDLVADGVISGLWLQACAAARSNDQVARHCRRLLASLLADAERLTGATSNDLADFLADGALVLLLQSLGVDLAGGSRVAVEALRAEGAGT